MWKKCLTHWAVTSLLIGPGWAAANQDAQVFIEEVVTEEVVPEKVTVGSPLRIVSWPWLTAAFCLNHFALVAQRQGRFDAAVQYMRHALEINETLLPGSDIVAGNIYNLGVLFQRRGQLAEAKEAFQRSMALWQQSSPYDAHLANNLNGLGDVACGLGELEKAEQFYEESLAIWQKVWPDSLGVAENWSDLGVVAWDRGDLGAATAAYRQALSIQQQEAPASLSVAETLTNLAEIAYESGDLSLAEDLFGQSLATHQKLAPDSRCAALNLNGLARIASAHGHHVLAESYFRRSLDALENQIDQLGGSQDVKAGFRSQNRRQYLDAIDFFLRIGEPEEAFTILERSRARSFLTMLQERELFFRDIPPELDQQRRDLATRHDRALQKIAFLNAAEDQEEVAALQEKLARLYRERDELRARIRSASPHLADLREPRAVTFWEAQASLDPGTVLLSYSVGEEQTNLFIVAPEQMLAVRHLPIGAAELEEDVGHLRDAIEGSVAGDFLSQRRRREVEEIGARLHRLLVEPAADIIEKGQRVVVVPDGPLHRLPFAALVREDRFFALYRPLHSVLSATVYAGLKSRRPVSDDPNGPLLAAFGDPNYLDPVSDGRVRSSIGPCRFDVERLPASRREVLEIAALHRNVRTYLGDGAREEGIKALDSDAKIIHIAAHGCYDDRLPLNSGLFLSLPTDDVTGKRENGFLQAWEIFESVRLDADLVVLSACQSGLGQELGGEGLIGLTRAFQYAGARSVAASLWQVDDQVTAELMLRFYRHLRSGKTKNTALQAAQIDLIQTPIEVRGDDGETLMIDASAPYFWAAFQILGDWR